MATTGTGARRRGLLVLGAVAVALAAFVGCGETSGDSEGEGESAAKRGSAAQALPEIKSGEELTIGFSHYAGVIPFYQAMTQGVEDAAKAHGWDVTVTDSQFDPSKQLADIQSMITRGVDVIIASPGDQEALIPAYKQAADAGIPVISIANRVGPSGQKYETSWYGRPWQEVGKIATELLVEAMGEKGDVVRVEGPAGVAFVNDQREGTEEVLAQHPNVRIVFSQNAKALSADEGFRLGREGLTAHPDVQGAWAQDDEIALGLVRALEGRGLAGEVPVAWNGGSTPLMDLAAKGQVLGVAYPTYRWGQDLVERLRAAVVDGASLPKVINPDIIEVPNAETARGLIAECDSQPNELWCLGRK
jgi:ribose transport system substrate-binding protein